MNSQNILGNPHNTKWSGQPWKLTCNLLFSQLTLWPFPCAHNQGPWMLGQRRRERKSLASARSSFNWDGNTKRATQLWKGGWGAVFCPTKEKSRKLVSLCQAPELMGRKGTNKEIHWGFLNATPSSWNLLGQKKKKKRMGNDNSNK